jgi:hypothetical protein
VPLASIARPPTPTIEVEIVVMIPLGDTFRTTPEERPVRESYVVEALKYRFPAASTTKPTGLPIALDVAVTPSTKPALGFPAKVVMMPPEILRIR